MSNQSAPAKKRGCLFYGCLSLAIIALVLAIFVGVGIYFAKRTVDQLVTTYTSTTPEKIEERPYPAPQLQELRTRVDSFQQSIQKGATQPTELILTADDLNAMIAADRELRGKLLVQIEDDQIKGQLSYPLPDVGPLKLKGRYLNGTAAFKVSLNNGQLDARIDQVSVHNTPLPPLMLSELRKVDLTRELRNNPESARVMERVESLEVRDGKVVIRSKPSAPSPAPAPPGQ